MKRFSINIFLFILTLTAAVTALAENITLTGVVKDQEGHPIEFATVKVQGKAIGTLTELDGSYKLVLAAADTIPMQFSCIGYREVKKGHRLSQQYRWNGPDRPF